MIPHADGIAIGVVVATYPEGQSIDVLLSEDGSRLSNIQVMVPTGSSNTGLIDLPDIGAAVGDARWDITASTERSVRAVLVFYRGVPVCIGFILPQVSQMTFQQKNRKIDRHASDVYSTIDAAGNMETYHPSGSYVRIGSSPAHEDLTQKDYDQQWAIKNNTSAAVHFHLCVANAGSVVATVDIDPSGNVTLSNNGNLTATVGGTTSINSSGNMELTAPQITLNGNTIINGTTTANGSVSATGAVTGSSSITAPNLVGTTDVTFGGKSAIGHTHGNVQNGADHTSTAI